MDNAIEAAEARVATASAPFLDMMAETAKRLEQAQRERDLATIRAMIAARPRGGGK